MKRRVINLVCMKLSPPRRAFRVLSILCSLLLLAACSTSSDRPPAGGAPGGPEGDGCRAVLENSVTVPLLLRASGEGCDYLIRGMLNISAPLTIEAGTEIVFAVDSLLSIEDGGSIHALGRPEARIVMKGQLDTHGSWYGICFGASRRSELVNVDLLNAGKVLSYGSSVCRGAIGAWSGHGEPVDLRRVLVAGSATSGLDATRLRLGRFEGNAFIANSDYGVQANAGQVHLLDAGSDYSGAAGGAPNGQQVVRLQGVLEAPGSSVTWQRLNVPYFIGAAEGYPEEGVIVGDGTRLVLAEGSEFIFGDRAGLNVWERSTLVTLGSPAAPVVLRGEGERPGSWSGVWVNDSSVRLQHTVISWGGADRLTNANLIIDGSEMPDSSFLDSVSLRGSAACGIHVDPELADRVFVDDLDFRGNVQDICS